MEILDILFPSKICITLKESKIRQAHFQKNMEDIGLKVPFFMAERMKDIREGCFDSHVRCMKDAVDNNGSKPLMVFEDDSRFRSHLPKHVVQDVCLEIQRYVQENPDFDIIQLGWCTGSEIPKRLFQCLSTVKRLQGYRHLYQSQCACTHAIVYSQKLMRRFLSSKWSDYNNRAIPADGIDNVLLQTVRSTKTVLVNPSLFTQDWCSSSNEWYSNPLCHAAARIDIDKSMSHIINISPIVIKLTYALLVLLHFGIIMLQLLPLITTNIKWIALSILLNVIIIWQWYKFGICLLTPLENTLTNTKSNNYSHVTHFISKTLHISINKVGFMLELLPLISVIIGIFVIIRSGCSTKYQKKLKVR